MQQRTQHYNKILRFLNDCFQVSECQILEKKKPGIGNGKTKKLF